MGALVIAFLALLMNFVQFREFLRRSRARAEFIVIPKTQNANSDGVLRTEGTVVSGRVEIGIKNNGRKAAGETLVNVVYPRRYEARWCGAMGEESEASSSPTPTSEVLVDQDREYDDCIFLSRIVPRIGTKPHHTLYFQFTMLDVPEQPDRELRVPVRIRVQADELPDDIEEYVQDLVVRVAQRSPT